jgi:hypothetical protein
MRKSVTTIIPWLKPAMIFFVPTGFGTPLSSVGAKNSRASSLVPESLLNGIDPFLYRSAGAVGVPHCRGS